MTATPRRTADRARLRTLATTTTRPVKRARVLQADELQEMLALADARESALLSLMAAGACRVGEVSLIQWVDINDGIAQLPASITKTRRARWFSLPELTALALERWRELQPPSPWVFPGRDPTKPASVRRLQQLITTLAERAGLEGVSSHSLRRSAITAAHRAGLPMAAVAQVSGHASVRQLERYIDGAGCRDLAEQARGLLLTNATKIQS